jgi:outer membrane protein OmpA-like peptidoglycan-associated protein
MKKLIIASTIAFALVQANPASADTPANESRNLQSEQKHENARNELIGFGSGAVAGALIGGPIGGQQAAEFSALAEQYAQLEQSNMVQLASFDTKVATEWMRDLPALESNVQFKTASFLVEEPFKSQLKSLAGLLKQYPDLMVKISGFADARGDSQYNRILSEQRAESVKDFLVTQRVMPKQIITQGQGELVQNTAQQSGSDASPSQEYESLFFDRKVTLKLINEQNAIAAAN